jgi:hypothetical protein
MCYWTGKRAGKGKRNRNFVVQMPWYINQKNKNCASV